MVWGGGRRSIHMRVNINVRSKVNVSGVRFAPVFRPIRPSDFLRKVRSISRAADAAMLFYLYFGLYIYFTVSTISATVTSVHGRRKRGGTGGRVPRRRKISGGRPPRIYDISVSFFFKRMRSLHFPTFSK